MKSPHWWSNQAVPSTASVPAVDRQRAGRPSSPCASSSTSRRPARSRSSRRCRGAPAAWSARAARSRPSPPGRRPRPPRPATSAATSRSVPSRPAIVHGARVGASPGGSGSAPTIARSKPVGSPAASPRRAVDARADLQPLAVEEALARLVGDREVRRPTRSGSAPRSARKMTYSKPKRRPSAVAEVAGVVPPLGQPVVRAVVAWQDDGERIRRPRRAGRSAARPTGAARSGWRGSGRRRQPEPARRATPGATRPRRQPRRRGRRPLIGRGLDVGLGRGSRSATNRSSAPASTSSSGRAGASWPARAAPGRRSRRGRPRSPCPIPSALIRTMSAKANEPATTTTISAAEVTIRPLRSRPRATASVLSPVRSQTSFIRVSRKTS